MKSTGLPILVFFIVGGFLLFSFKSKVQNTEYFFNNDIPKEEENPNDISILSFGDIMFDRGVLKRMDKGVDPFLFLPEIKKVFRKRIDFLSANLEGPITDSLNCQKKPYSFRFSTTTASLLWKLGFNELNVNNNHSFDCFKKGEEDTLKYLSLAGMGVFGSPEKSHLYDVSLVRGKEIGFLGIDESIKKMDREKIKKELQSLKTTADYIIVNIHWGEEYNPSFTKAQQDSGRFLIDNGADAVIGHHPHVIEPVEIYKDKPIFYSLGNFIFDQVGKEQNEGVAVGVLFGEKIISFQVIPYSITNSQPQVLGGADRLSFCKKFLENVLSAKNCIFK